MLVRNAVCAVFFLHLTLLGSLARAQGASDKEIVLGQSVYLTGALAELGTDFTSGANAYFQKVNEAGGVLGRKIRVITLDDAYDPKKALANVAELEKQDVFALWQFAGTGTVREVAPIAASHHIPLIAAIATGPKLRSELNPYTFFVRAGNKEEIQAIVKHVVAIGVRRVAVVYVDAPYGEEGFEEVKSETMSKGISIVGTATLKTKGDGAEEAVKKLVQSNAEAVVMITVPDSSKAFIRAARRASFTPTLYCLNAGLPVGAMQELGEDAHGVVVTQVMPNVNRSTIPVVREYQQAVKAAGGSKFSSASLEGFINAKVMVEALKRTGKHLTRDGLIQALEGMSSFDTGGYIVGFSHSAHGGNRSVELSMSGADGKNYVY